FARSRNPLATHGRTIHWVKSGHFAVQSPCPLYPSQADISKPNWNVHFAAAGGQIACFPPVRNAASIQTGSRYIREIPDPSRSFTHLDRKDASRLFAATGSY